MTSGAPLLGFQTDIGISPGTLVVLGVAALILLLAALAFVYMLLLRRGWGSGLIRHPILHRMDEMLSSYLPGFWRFVRARFTIGQWHGLALTIGSLALFLGAFAFAGIAESWVDQEGLYQLDHRVGTWLAESMNEPTTGFMRTVTRFGDREVVWALGVTIGLYLLYRRFYWHVLTLMLAPGVGSAAVVGFKALFGRTRPESEAATMLGHSFPSGHAFAAMTFYGFMIYLVWRHVRNDWIRIITTIFFVVIIFLVGLSRIMLRVHWLSDVIGGFTLGLAWLVCSIVLTYAIQSMTPKNRKTPVELKGREER